MEGGSYFQRFWSRFFRDAAPWARDNIFWGLLVLLVPAVFVYFRNRHAQIDWNVIESTILLYAVALFIYIVSHLCRTPGKLDADREKREASLISAIAERDQTILKFNAKPPRSAAEQHHYDVAKKALEQFGPKAVIALRHLKTHGKLTFGTFYPPLPAGMKGEDAVWAYNACVGEGLVTVHDRLGAIPFVLRLSSSESTLLKQWLF